ncbi:MAG: hypothetical protein JG781_844 [Peptococcaceae bacterium]|jgi:probable selenium-dependent hydroxylase accessory protein YqeC|nr:hypothetical protein [Peptococcaceae bacterium]
MKLSEALEVSEAGIITAVGAGGKTSLLLSLATEWCDRKAPFLLTTTTKMFFWQVQNHRPVICRDYERGVRYLRKLLDRHGFASWFTRWRGIKVDGVPPHWLDVFFQTQLVPHIFVEGDGARRKLIKAPAPHEPVVPFSNHLTLGVINLGALGRALTPRHVHRPEILARLLDKSLGDTIEVRDIAVLAGHKQGIFKGTPGEKALVLTGGNRTDVSSGEKILKYLSTANEVGIKRLILTEGFGGKMRVIEVFHL